MTFPEYAAYWWKYFDGIIAPSIWATLRMLSASMLLALLFGFTIAVLLILYGPQGLRPAPNRYKVIDFFVNSIRSFPIIILIVAISPLTRMLVGTTIGEKAAIFPLTVAATPFLARILENSMRAVNPQLIEAARSFGASDWQIITRVMVKEALPLIVSGTTLAAITFLSATTLAGAVGAGGIGAVALNYGYQSFNNTVLYTSVIILFIMVQLLQFTGDWLYKKIL
ncbi:methionine ABC transporter permease [Desulfofustis glycolicus]|uniref:D-methionine transport system permease protein n=1 Tax=Desulfofustis glycolicus DSM 9705 TaxID=1121409 RepID=A0A1M5WPF7_9BACT|nr:methionine ABC transporter permease [Desulfofustis glycolicus]MCB2218733.1 ABC transporter permease [Desulfobulbaceae bacterium]SHH89388.1 D-methionine transport system permease protein [Desulfofustis glycolicus DSM 9705]